MLTTKQEAHVNELAEVAKELTEEHSEALFAKQVAMDLGGDNLAEAIQMGADAIKAQRDLYDEAVVAQLGGM